MLLTRKLIQWNEPRYNKAFFFFSSKFSVISQTFTDCLQNKKIWPDLFIKQSLQTSALFLGHFNPNIRIVRRGSARHFWPSDMKGLECLVEKSHETKTRLGEELCDLLVMSAMDTEQEAQPWHSMPIEQALTPSGCHQSPQLTITFVQGR